MRVSMDDPGRDERRDARKVIKGSVQIVHLTEEKSRTPASMVCAVRMR